MYKYSVDNRRWILSILISPFSWASVTLCEQLGSAPLGLQASAQEKTLFSSSVSSIEGLLLQHNTTAQRSPTEGSRAKEKREARPASSIFSPCCWSTKSTKGTSSQPPLEEKEEGQAWLFVVNCCGYHENTTQFMAPHFNLI